MVCQACRTVLLRKGEPIFDRRRKHDSAVVHHETVEGLRAAAEDEKCSICYSLWTKLSLEARSTAISRASELHNEDQHEWRRHATEATIEKEFDVFEWQESKASFIATRFRHAIRHVVREDGPWRFYVRLSGSLSDLVGREPGYKFYDLHAENNISSLARMTSLASTTTAFPETAQTASQWLQQCCKHHRACNDDHNRGCWNPTRMLDVGNEPTHSIKLIDSASISSTLTYVTLSHRWGKSHVPQLTNETKERYAVAIALDTLPLTFQHAVLVARELGFRFLWIDSLCIKQDDPSDWLSEASLMHKVYRHGHLNISATGAVDGSEGLFATRDQTAQGFEHVDIMVEGLSGGVTPCIAVDSHFWNDNVKEAPLNKRGWVLQERVLSKRVLHFGKTQIFWECRELEAAETFPDGLSPKSSSRPTFKCLDPVLRGKIMQDLDGPYRDRRFAAYDMWTEIAATYSACSLTKWEDKALAIMGLAKHMNGLINDTYVAGMWRRFLVSELTWRCDGTRSQPDTYTAPTWSWLCQNAKVICSTASDTGTRLSVKAVDLQYATQDQCGPLLGGRIYLEGVLRRAKIRRNRPASPPDTSAWSLILPDLKVRDDSGSTEGVVHLDSPPDNFDKENDDGSLFCMEVLDDPEYWATLDLLLLRCEDRQQGVFSRIGLSVEHDSRKALLADRKRVSELPCVSWDANKKLHTICVV